jgi:cysteine desulfurase
MRVYLDNAATTPMDPRVLKAMLLYFKDNFGNAMSVHQFGQEALAGVEQAREQVAKFLYCEPQEIIFTSGATESNNLVLKGIVDAYRGKGKPHIVTTAIEHHCVLETAEYLQKKGLAEVTFIQPNKDGIVSSQAVKNAIKQNTVLVSVMYVNNEIGTIQPIREIGKIIKQKNLKSYNLNLITYFHTDAVQAINYLNCDVQKLGVDLLSFSGHKIYGPKGIGVLFIKKGTKINKIQHGGEQETGMRAGTHNVPSIVGLGKAVELLNHEGTKNTENTKILRDYLWKGIKKNIPNIVLNGSLTKRVPNNLNVSFKNVEGEGILIALDLEGIAVSTGSACSSGSLEPSYVMMAISRNDHLRSHSSVRFSLNKYTTKKDIDYVLRKLPIVIKQLRVMSPFKD